MMINKNQNGLKGKKNYYCLVNVKRSGLVTLNLFQGRICEGMLKQDFDVSSRRTFSMTLRQKFVDTTVEYFVMFLMTFVVKLPFFVVNNSIVENSCCHLLNNRKNSLTFGAKSE